MSINFKNIISGTNKKYWLRFLLRGGILFAVFLLFYGFLRKVDIINTWYEIGLNNFAIFLLDISASFLHLLGYEVVTYGKTVKIVDNLITSGVYLDRGCMGRNVLLAFSAFIIIFPGKVKNKLWYIPLGIIILNFVNILRIVGLAITYHCCKEYGDINHHFVFKIIAWAVIFLLWVIWINKFSPFNKTTKKTS